MITIFCDFRQFSAKNWRFLKNQCCDQIFAYFSFVLSKNHNGAPCSHCVDLQLYGHDAADDRCVAQHSERRVLRVQAQVPDPAQHLQNKGTRGRPNVILSI
jgi:hypothetical protein